MKTFSEKIQDRIELLISERIDYKVVKQLIIIASCMEMALGYFNDYDVLVRNIGRELTAQDIFNSKEMEALSRQKRKELDKIVQKVLTRMLDKNESFKREMETLNNVIDSLPEIQTEIIYELQDVIVKAVDEYYQKNTQISK
jgi:predicted nucleic-acid-binding protein